MENSNQVSKNQVPMGQKIAFGMGMLANQMFPAVLGIFMVVLVQNLGFPAWMWSVIYFFPRIFDAFSDPIMGFITDNTKSKWGRRRQYVLIGSIIMGIAFILMWQMYKADGVNYNFAYFMFWSFIFYLGLTIFSVPYVAMGYEMSDDFHERTQIMAIAQWIGQWAWVIAPWFWVIMYITGEDSYFGFESTESATRTLAIWVGSILTLVAIIPAIFIKSKSTLHENYASLNLNNIKGSFNEIILGFKEALIIKPFRKLCIATFLIFNAFNTVSTFTFFVIVYQLFNGNTEEANKGYWPTLFGCLSAVATTFIVIPIVAWMSKKMGKKNAFILSQGISIIGYIMLWFLLIPGKPYLFIIALPFFSFGIGSLFTLMMSMTSDVIDLDELNTGKRREGIFGAIYWWMVKFGFAIAGALSGVILTLVGFKEGVPTTEQESAIVGLRIFFSGLPILGTLIAMYIMWDYDVTEEKAKEVSAVLKARKSKPKTSSSHYNINSIPFPIQHLNVDTSSNVDFSNKSESEIKALFYEKLNQKMHGLCFSPYMEGQDIGDILSEDQIRRRMEIVKPYTRWVRSFSCTEGNEFIPKVAKELGLKTMVGAWIGSNKSENEIEIDALIQLAKKGHVDIAVIGNEALMRNDLALAEILQYITKVKQALPNIPVGYVDAYFQFYENPALVDACDIIMANCYPFWENCTIDESTTYLKKMYAVLQQISKGKPIIVSETGWPSQGSNVGNAEPSPINAMKYFINVQNWQEHENIKLFYFSSFDESWKVHHEGDVGERWGLWDKTEKLKF